MSTFYTNEDGSPMDTQHYAIDEYEISALDHEGNRRPAFYVFAYNEGHAIDLARKLSPGASSIEATIQD